MRHLSWDCVKNVDYCCEQPPVRLPSVSNTVVSKLTTRPFIGASHPTFVSKNNYNTFLNRKKCFNTTNKKLNNIICY